jgi:hypothetical protein
MGAALKTTDPFQSDLNDTLRASLGDTPPASQARARAREMLELDELNWSYFFCLYQRRFGQAKGGAQARPLQIHEPGRDPGDRSVVYPTAIAPPEMLRHLRRVEYREIARPEAGHAEVAKGAAIWVKKMQAGSGSSMTRTSYLARRTGRPESAVKIGAKGTDLFVDVPGGSIPIAEAQILQTLLDFQRGEVGEVIFHDIVSSETEESLRELWRKPSRPDPSKTYAQLVAAMPGVSRFGESYQSFIPTVDESGQISFGRVAPGGHSLFAIDALRAAFREELRPRTPRPLVAAISNGEDLSSAPDRHMIGYLVKHRVPIALVTTEKTPVDVKGGIVSLLKDAEGNVSLTVLETAQAKEAGQLKLFESLQGSISTNMTLFNYDALVPLLTREVAEIGEDEFLRIISPDLIANVKEQKDRDGRTRKYTQLEGTMGSTIMNLDRYWRKKHGEPLVHLIDVDRRLRTEFFSPIKSAFDYFMQFHSDRFAFDADRMRLRNLRPGELPLIALSDPATRDKFWADVENVLDAFRGASVRELDELSVEGPVGLAGAKLGGRVRIVNRAGRRVDLAAQLPDRRIADATVEIGADGSVRA